MERLPENLSGCLMSVYLWKRLPESTTQQSFCAVKISGSLCLPGYIGFSLNQDKATKPQTVWQGEATPYWFKLNLLSGI
jgi:hypothetical protein